MEQVIPARHGVATFVPAGRVIKIINTSGTQVISTWAIALPKPESKLEEVSESKQKEGGFEQTNANTSTEPKKNGEQSASQRRADNTDTKESKSSSRKTKITRNLPSQEEAERATSGATIKEQEKIPPKPKSTWGSYVPSLPQWSSKKEASKDKKQVTQQEKDSKTWASYFPSGKAVSAYIPKSASDTISAFASSHYRDPSKSVFEQLQDFSKTPVGAAGLAAMTGSGYSGSLYAGYQAYQHISPDAPPMEYMSMSHTRAASLHLRPKVDDTFLSNLREPVMTLIEDSSSGVHDTLLAACDPNQYRNLGIDNWHEHGSCAENLVLALKELNDRAGLKGVKAVGADITVNTAPPSLNLFSKVSWQDTDLKLETPDKQEGAFVRFRVDRDVVVIMSACPQDVLDINGAEPTDAQFLVEEDEMSQQEKKQARRRSQPRKLSSFRAPSTVATGDLADDDKSRQGSDFVKKPTRKTKTASVSAAESSEAAKSTPSASKVEQDDVASKAKVSESKPPVQANTEAPNAASAEQPTTSVVQRKKPRKLATKSKSRS